MYQTNYRLENTGMHATVLTVKTCKRTTGIGAEYWPIATPTNTGKYLPIPDTGISLTLLIIVLIYRH